MAAFPNSIRAHAKVEAIVSWKRNLLEESLMVQKIVRSFLLVLGALLLIGSAQRQELEDGIRLYQENKFMDAQQVLRQVIENDAENPQAHYYLALSLLGLEKLEDAEVEMNLAAEWGLPADKAKVGLARVFMKKGETAQALTVLNLAEQDDAENSELYYYRGIVKASRQDFAGSAADLEKAIQLEPSNPYSYYYAGMSYSRLKRPDKMVNHFQTFLRLAPKAPEAPKVQSLLRSVR
jgi:tetratricopeptide (TPR) repeat protein